MLFIRRIFYDPNTGDILHAYMMRGDICSDTAEADAERLNLADYGVLEWTAATMDTAIEAQFADPYNNQVSVDIATSPPALIFGHVDVPEPAMGDPAVAEEA